MKSNSKGITLIALVITIIVMLILVSVTISMAVNGGLFDYAGKAVGDTKNAMDAEQALANGGIEVDGVWYDSIDDYLANKPAVKTIHSWTRGTGENIDKFTCSHCNKTYTMGETVPYTATGTSKVYASRLGLTAEEMGAEEAEITSQDTTWVVLGIQDTNGDDINETLLITSAGPVGAVVDGSVMATLPMYGAAAYNNGPSEINRICKELYSNSQYGEARGMTIEDVNAALNFTPFGGIYYDGSKYYTTGNLTTKLKDVPVFNSLKENGTKTPDGTNTEAALGEYELNGYWYFLNDDGTALANEVDSTTSAITTVEKNTIFGASADYVYWLASRGVYAGSSYAVFGPGGVGEGGAGSYGNFFFSYGNELDYGAGLRPVVSLTSKLPVSE